MLFVLKRSGEVEPFKRTKLIAGMRAACKQPRPVPLPSIESLAERIEEELPRWWPRGDEGEQVGVAVLDHLQEL